MESRNQYLDRLIRKYGGYHLQTKKKKTLLLDEYTQTTGQNRKYVIEKLRLGTWVEQMRKKKIKKKRTRKRYYDNTVKYYLIKCWSIFDQPCGQRLASILEKEVYHLIQSGELHCSNEIAEKLKCISPRKIDDLLKTHKEKEQQKRQYSYKNNPLLYEKIPTKLSDEWDRSITGNIQIDLVENCGRYNYGEYIHTLSTTDICSGWWEGQAQLTRSMKVTIKSLKKIKQRYPLEWKSIHTDNDTAFINEQLAAYSRKEHLDFTRSRPYKKNDNCWIEQKNSTHVRRCIGHLRYDTLKEMNIINDLYANEVRLYKNFFQPVMKLISKERIGGHIKRKYDKPKTPYLRIMERHDVDLSVKKKLRKQYESLNPALLKRQIDKKLSHLRRLYEFKQSATTNAKINSYNTVRFLNCTTDPISVI